MARRYLGQCKEVIWANTFGSLEELARQVMICEQLINTVKHHLPKGRWKQVCMQIHDFNLRDRLAHGLLNSIKAESRL